MSLKPRVKRVQNQPSHHFEVALQPQVRLVDGMAHQDPTLGRNEAVDSDVDDLDDGSDCRAGQRI